MTTLLTDIINNIQLSDEALDILIEDFISDHNYYFGTTATSGIDEFYVAYATTASGWRAEGFRDAWNQSYRANNFIVFNDNINTPLYKADMMEYDNLIDGNNSSNISFNYNDTSYSWLSLEYPTERTTNLIKVGVTNSGINAYFAYSVDSVNWICLADPGYTHVSTTLSGYDSTTVSGIDNYVTFSGVEDYYCTLSSGINTYTTSDNFRMKYFKMFFYTTASGTNDATLSLFSCGQQTYIEDLAAGTIDTSRLVISSPDGKTTFDGNTIIIKDTLGNTRVELGLLE